MSKTLNRDQIMKQARAKHAYAIQRDELRGPSTPRASAASPTSLGVKVVDPETRRLIDEALAARRSS